MSEHLPEAARWGDTRRWTSWNRRRRTSLRRPNLTQPRRTASASWRCTASASSARARRSSRSGSRSSGPCGSTASGEAAARTPSPSRAPSSPRTSPPTPYSASRARAIRPARASRVPAPGGGAAPDALPLAPGPHALRAPLHRARPHLRRAFPRHPRHGGGHRRPRAGCSHLADLRGQEGSEVQVGGTAGQALRHAPHQGGGGAAQEEVAGSARRLVDQDAEQGEEGVLKPCGRPRHPSCQGSPGGRTRRRVACSKA